MEQGKRQNKKNNLLGEYQTFIIKLPFQSKDIWIT